jgi:ketopantoate hydroxymethyltransferase
MSALSHSNRVSDEAVKAARDAFVVENVDYSDDETCMRRAVEAAVRVLKAEQSASRSERSAQP